VTYADVKAAYPRYQLPQGTYSWQPATRTVNGGPGWSAPPKPKPRLTRLARVRKIVLGVLQPVERFWELTGRHWALVMFLAMATVIVGRISARTRAMLRSQIARQRLRENCGDTYPWMILFRLEPVELKRQERAKLLLRSAGQRVWHLALDGESRPVLIVGILSHSLLAWTFVRLVETFLSNGGP
jgi:hypothetical protein